MDKLTIVTYADLGTRENLKTKAILPLVKYLKKNNQVEQVIYRWGEFNDPKFVKSMGSLQHGLVWIIKRCIDRKIGRKLEELLLDFNSSWKLKNAKSSILLHPNQYPRVQRKAKNQKRIVILIATSPHPVYNINVIREESSIYGINNKNLKVPRKTIDGIYNSDYIIALSEFSKKTYIEKGYSNDKIFVANLDVDTIYFHPRYTKEKKDLFRVFFPATGSDLRRGLLYLLDAWSNVDIVKGELRLAGNVYGLNSDLDHIIEKKINTLSSLKILGVLSKSEMRNEYQYADVVVLPSLFEGFAKTVAEAMACGKPVITTKHACALVEHGYSGFIVPIRDSNAIKDCINYLYNNPSIANQIGKNARSVVLNKSTFGEEVKNILNHIHENHV